MVLRALQDLLATIYDAPIEHDVGDFLVTSLAAYPDLESDTATDEQLLVASDGAELELGLYVASEVLDRLADANPLTALTGANLADCWTALEGVSHFHYLAYHAGHDRAVSRLELETQAEIDKYVATLWLLREQAPGHFPLELHALLFARCRIDPRVGAERASLYRRASAYAARYCRRVERMLQRAATSGRDGVTNELRRFYRLSGSGKLAQLERCAPA
jgi:hypothetical protein